MALGASVLVAEDDEEMRRSILSSLHEEGYAAIGAASLDDAVRLATQDRPDLALIDVSLSADRDGFVLARKLREIGDFPLIFVTGASGLDDRLAGFEEGADDYLTKPFALSELLARMRAVLRRAGVLASHSWSTQGLVVDEASHTVTYQDMQVELTNIEFKLLVAFCRYQNIVLSKVQLLSEVWGFDHYSLNLVEVHISSLRRKLEAHGPRLIQTVRGVGYVVRSPAPEARQPEMASA